MIFLSYFRNDFLILILNVNILKIYYKKENTVFLWNTVKPMILKSKY